MPACRQKCWLPSLPVSVVPCSTPSPLSCSYRFNCPDVIIIGCQKSQNLVNYDWSYVDMSPWTGINNDNFKAVHVFSHHGMVGCWGMWARWAA